MNLISTDKVPSILVVDDVVKNIQLIANILHREGFRIEFATNAQETLEWIKNEIFDLILLDIMIPEIDGYEICKKIKKTEKYKDIPIIFLSAKNNANDIAKGFRVGGVDYITKPFQTDELVARVRTHIELRLQKQKLEKLLASKDQIISTTIYELKKSNDSILELSKTLKSNLTEYNKEEIQSYVDSVYSCVQDSCFILEKLLEWLKIQSDELKN